jgi:hypothetical protein
MEHVRTVLWRKTDDISIEYSVLQCDGDGFVLEGTVILILDSLPVKVTYRVDCDSHWRTRHVKLQQEQAGKVSKLLLDVDENQHWQENQVPLQFADGLFDVDFEISPATNTLPIHRLNLKVGESAKSTAVWVRFPSLKLERLKQRYSRVGDRSYRYEAPELGFEAQLEIDEAGLMVKYGDLWMRIA